MRSLLFALSAFGLATAGSPSVQQMQDRLREVEAAVLSGDAGLVRARLDAAAKADLRDLHSRVALAWCDIPSDASWNALKALATVHPKDPWPHLGMGRIYVRWKLSDLARAEFQTALRLSASFYPALVGLGDLARLAGDLGLAEQRYREALALAEDAEAYSGLGLALLRRGDGQSAVPLLEKAVSLWAAQPEPRRALLAHARERGDRAAAVRHAAALVALTPKDAAARLSQSEVLAEAGDAAGAAEALEAYLAVTPTDLAARRRLAQMWRALDRVDREEQALLRLARQDRADGAPARRLAELSRARGDLDAALAHVLDALERQPDDAEAHLTLARLRHQRQELVEALDEYRLTEAAGGAAAEVARGEAEELASRFALRATPAKGSIERIHSSVAASLNALYARRLRERPELFGTLRVRVRVGPDGKAAEVALIEDTVGDAALGGHVYFSLKDASYPRQKAQPTYEFELRPPRRTR